MSLWIYEFMGIWVYEFISLYELSDKPQICFSKAINQPAEGGNKLIN